MYIEISSNRETSFATIAPFGDSFFSHIRCGNVDQSCDRCWRSASVLAEYSSSVCKSFSQEPCRSLDVHATIPAAKKLVAQTYATKDQLWDLLLVCQAAKKRSAVYPGRRLMAGLGKLYQAQRDAIHLQLMGEPAGYDLQRRLEYIEVG